ncbi:UNVERIFIED_CONTAM: protein NRT1/ PTR FAMILY 4.4 [Sesamum radiatum]|uniref:Protein NRT1/ PTR FAMILY 4.4 n=1 Tax=Sesamum radiatum TaxID=300843 RepID=A0AAW2U8A8_SESRA
MGELVALTLLVYVQTHSGMDVGFGVSAAAMAMGLISFISGAFLYKNKPPQGSILTPIAQVFVAATLNRKHVCPSDPVMSHGIYHKEPNSDKPISNNFGNPHPTERFSVGLVEFFYKQPLKGMQSFLTAITYCSFSFGFFLSSVLVTLVNKASSDSSGAGWLSDNNLNKDKLDHFYWLLAVLSFINFLNYLFWATWYSNINQSLTGHRTAWS